MLFTIMENIESKQVAAPALLLFHGYTREYFGQSRRWQPSEMELDTIYTVYNYTCFQKKFTAIVDGFAKIAMPTILRSITSDRSRFARFNHENSFIKINRIDSKYSVLSFPQLNKIDTACFCNHWCSDCSAHCGPMSNECALKPRSEICPCTKKMRINNEQNMRIRIWDLARKRSNYAIPFANAPICFESGKKF